MTATEVAALIAQRMSGTPRPRRRGERLWFAANHDAINVVLFDQNKPVQAFRVTVEEAPEGTLPGSP